MGILWNAERYSNASGSGTTSVTAVPATNCTAGALLVLTFAGRATGTPAVSVADTKTNTWTVDAGPVREPGNGWCFLASTVQGAGTLTTGDTITITITGGSPTVPMLTIQEFTGETTPTPFDVASTATAGGVTVGQTGTSGTTAQANEAVVCVFGWDDVVGTATPGAGYSTFTTTQLTNGGKSLSQQYKIVSGTGTQSGTMSISGIAQGVAGALATYKETGSVKSLPPELDRRVNRNTLLRRCSGILVPRLWLPQPGELLPAI